MRLLDLTKVCIRSGGGGAGCVSFRREEFVEFGGPDGGNGGSVRAGAATALVAANPRKNKTIFAEVFQDNPGSARLLAHAGFEHPGDAESFSVARGLRADPDLCADGNHPR